MILNVRHKSSIKSLYDDIESITKNTNAYSIRYKACAEVYNFVWSEECKRE